MARKESYEILACRGCGNMPIIFDDDDHYQMMYAGCMYSEPYCSSEHREKEGTEGCRLNYIKVEAHDGKFLSSLFIAWNGRQNKKSQAQDEKEDEHKKCFGESPSQFLASLPSIPIIGTAYRMMPVTPQPSLQEGVCYRIGSRTDEA